VTNPDDFGIYIHIPFCSTRCDYCAFTTFTKYGHLQKRYIDACIKEIDLTRKDGLFRTPTSVYLGGGTPSLIDGDDLTRLIKHLGVLPDTEITVECNPESFSEDLCALLKEAGVNRISLGVQSMVPKVLKDLGRPHYPGAVENSLGLINKYGFPTHSVDIIYGTNAETPEDLLKTLDTIFEIDKGLPHLSAYALTPEQGTPLARDSKRHPNEDRQATYYEIIDEYLHHRQMTWYEISNWARDGHQCRHNRLYWDQKPYLAIGCGAHGYIDSVRYWNASSLTKYIETIESGTLARAGSETLTKEQSELEFLFLKLRTDEGIPQDCLDFSKELDNLVVPTGSRYVLTRNGRLLANEVAHRLKVPSGA